MHIGIDNYACECRFKGMHWSKQEFEMYLTVFEHMDEILKCLHVFDQSSLKSNIFLENDFYWTQQVSSNWGSEV